MCRAPRAPTLCRFLQKNASTFFTGDNYLRATAEYCATFDVALSNKLAPSTRAKLTSAQVLDEPMAKA